MTQFIGTSDICALLRRTGIEPFLTGLAGSIEADFRRWESFEKAARLASHSCNGVIELMPASDGELYAMKFVNGHPGNTAAGKLTVTAFGVLADVATGYPVLVSEMTILTALRTAATSAVAARALSRGDSRVLALIGAGAQSEFQALAFKALLGVEEVRVFDIDSEAMDKFCLNLAASGLRIRRAGSVAEAVDGADIVTTCTADKTRAYVLTPDLVVAGMHLNAIGGDCPGKTELHPDIVARAAVYTEYTPQTRIEGEIQQLPADFAVTELWQVLAGKAAGRSSADEVTLFDSVGFAIEDFSTLRYVRDLSRAEIRDIDLIPDLDDPKDLFGLLAAQSQRLAPRLGDAPAPGDPTSANASTDVSLLPA
ncbi:ornithine cyclodeaminase [Devosia insulae DS-56]|uniref:Ornithine cyclodeaminase n=1 Tax=Devosia insulae DS-56 TaxID=1116389 RepID=A0A1E5XNX0_9HYPH|nr:ornithine cyclodeaminase [Devosia insulae]OEO30288.1 ornithine cyclodeaminase [Devosia insulae DS-56]